MMLHLFKLVGLKTLIKPNSLVSVKVMEGFGDNMRYYTSYGEFNRLRVSHNIMVVLRIKQSKMHRDLYKVFNLTSPMVVEVCFYLTLEDLRKRRPYLVIKN